MLAAASPTSPEAFHAHIALRSLSRDGAEQCLVQRSAESGVRRAHGRGVRGRARELLSLSAPDAEPYLIVDQFYLSALRGVGGLFPEDEIPFPDAAELAAAQAGVDRELIAFCDSVNEADLEREVTIDRNDGVIHRETIAAVLAHLFVHQIHHRGQAHAMLSGTQVPPPQLDEFFLASDLPLRESELRQLGLARR